jgi:hypothetical protein
MMVSNVLHLISVQGPKAVISGYVVEPGSRYQPGEVRKSLCIGLKMYSFPQVFKIVWCKPRPGGGARGHDNSSTAAVIDGQTTTPEPSFHQGIRRFIVVANDEGHCTCV